MTTYVAFTTPPGFKEDSEELMEKLRAGTKEPMAKKAVKVADVFVECMMNAFIFDFIEAVELKPGTEKIMNKLGQLVLKTANTLLDKVIAKLPNEELVDMVEIFEQRELVVGDELYLTFPLPDKRAASFRHCMDQIEQGHGATVRPEFEEGMKEFAQLALHYYMEESLNAIKLGRIMRKIADVAYATVDKASQAAIKRVIGNMDETEMVEFAAYLKTLLLDHEA